MVKHNADTPGTLYLGVQGEDHAKTIAFDCAAWAQQYGPGEVQLLHRRCGEADPYPVPLRKEGDLVIWDVSNVDTACTGKGEAQLLYFVDGKLAKSSLATTDVQPSLSEPGPVPDAQQPFLDAVTAQAAKAEAAAKRAEDAAADAQQGAGAPQDYVDQQDATNLDKAKKYTDVSAYRLRQDFEGADAQLLAALESVNAQLTAFFDSDDQTLDQLTEIVAYIKSNKTLIDAITTSKVSKTDIINNLVTDDSDKPDRKSVV